MTGQVFDDGSVLTWDDNYGTVMSYPAPDAPVINRASANWSPSQVTPGASSWDDVLKFGLSRLIDAHSRPVAPENTAPALVRAPVGFAQSARPGTVGALLASPMVWIILGAVVFFASKK